jgi:CHAT domain-containing protein/Tfp pilus assembly protein PilF
MQEEIAPGSLNMSSTLNNLCAVSQEVGDLGGAAEYCRRALEIESRLAQGSLNMARIYNSLGNIHLASGDLSAAVQHYEMSLYILRARDDHNVDLVLNNLGIVSRLRGDLDSADQYYLQALRAMQDGVLQPVKVSRTLNNMGVVARRRGDLELADEYYRRSLSIRTAETKTDSLAIARILTNLGNNSTLRGDLDIAADYFMRALTLRQSQASGTTDVANSLNNLGNLAVRQGRLAAASEYLQRALEIREKQAPDSLELAVTLNSLAGLMRAGNDSSQVGELYRRALAIRERLAPATSSEEYLELGRWYRSRGDFGAAAEHFDHSLRAIESQLARLGSSRETESIFRSREQYPVFREALSLQVELNHLEAAFHLLERSRAQSYLAMLAERELVFSDLPPELDAERRRLAVQYDHTLQSLQDLSPAKDEEQVKKIQGDLLILRQRQQEIQVDIRGRFPRLAAIQYPQPLDFAAVQQALDPGTVLLAYSVGEKETFLFSVSPDRGLSVKKLAVGEAELRQKVIELRQLLDSVAARSSLGTLRAPRLRELSRELYTLLIQPAEASLEAGQRVLVLADGPLHLLPFAALQRSDGEYLGAWKSLHTALSATVWAELKTTRRPADGSAPAPTFTLAAFGDPHYPVFQSIEPQAGAQSIETARNVPGDFRVRAAVETGRFDWSPLPGTRREVQEIARLFPESSARIFLGQNATEETAKKLGREPHIIHFAVHGHLDDRFPWNSALALSIPENPPEGHENGLLQVWEILEGVRFDADLVVLSACETGLGEEQGGEGLLGLTRAFQYAGARTVLASLWSVNDLATSELMIRFYKHLRAGLPKDQALQAAQQELIQGPIEIVNEKGERERRDFSAPYYWAGFQLYGDWQ